MVLMVLQWHCLDVYVEFRYVLHMCVVGVQYSCVRGVEEVLISFV